MMNDAKETIAIVGLGYVGLPLAVAFAEQFPVIGFDINSKRILELQSGKDTTESLSESALQKVKINILFTSSPEELKKAKYIIVAVPTPVDDAKHPDLMPLQIASTIVGKNLMKEAIVIYESTVYPGVTEDVCLPILEKESGLCLANGEFGLGYSPERINPGDDKHRLDNVIKIVSGHNKETLEKVAALYETIVIVGVYKASSIKVAEAAKITENIQRDTNIAVVNELALIFNKLGIDTKEVLDAAGTKWNFHKYSPGLVGGHCIGVDPYYLAHQATKHGYHPKIILSSREVNDYMARHIVEMTIKELNAAGKIVKDSVVVIFGLTFKENVTDIRNTRAGDVVNYLKEFGITVIGCEPNVEQEIIRQKMGIENVALEKIPEHDAAILINKHAQFASLTLEVLKEKMQKPILIDVKHMFSKEEACRKGFVYRSL